MMDESTVNTQAKLEQEKILTREMVLLYCRKNHKPLNGTPCADCADLLIYAQSRLEHCPHMQSKTFCSSCKTHCYRPDMRDKIRAVMRWAGPRMILYHPIIAMRHLAEK